MYKTLKGKKIVVTRDKNQLAELLKILENCGAESLVFPTIKISAVENKNELDTVLKDINNYQWIIFSSANGVNYFIERLIQIKSTTYQNKVAVVGGKTLETLQSWGWKADLIPDEFSANGLLNSLKKHPLSGNKILLPSSGIARSELPDGLKKLGAHVTKITVYQNECYRDPSVTIIEEAIDQNTIDAILFFSPSAFECFRQILGTQKCSRLKNTKTIIAAIGKTTATSIESAGFRVDIIPPKESADSMIEAVANYFRITIETGTN
jgi:uroporphyrinogen III methyltransferase/synthase